MKVIKCHCDSWQIHNVTASVQLDFTHISYKRRYTMVLQLFGNLMKCLHKMRKFNNWNIMFSINFFQLCALSFKWYCFVFLTFIFSFCRNVCTEAGLFAIRSEREYVIQEDFMKAVRKVADNKKLESKLDYKPV